MWETWLHKDIEHSFVDFKRKYERPTVDAPVREETLVDALRDSRAMIDGFTP